MDDADVGLPGMPTRRIKTPTNAAAPKEKTPEQKLSQVSCHHVGFTRLGLPIRCISILINICAYI